MTIDADHYQSECSKTAIYPASDGRIYTILGLTNEAGELAGKYKKYLRDNTDYSVLREQLIAELGDVLWYCAMLADEMGVSLSDVMQQNLDKLKGRADRGTIGGSGDVR